MPMLYLYTSFFLRLDRRNCSILSKESKHAAQKESGRLSTVPFNPKIALKCDISDCETTVIVAVTSPAPPGNSAIETLHTVC